MFAFNVHLFSCSGGTDAMHELYLDWLLMVVFASILLHGPERGEERPKIFLHRCCDSCQEAAKAIGNNSVVVVNEHRYVSPNSLVPYKINMTALAHGIFSRRNGGDRLKVGLLHLNHEQPWAGPRDIRNYHPQEELLAHYLDNHWAYVIRNYYYAPYMDRGVHYLPLGPSYAGLYRQKTIVDRAARPSSQRSRLCYFAGQMRADRGVLADVIARCRLTCAFHTTITSRPQEKGGTSGYIEALLDTVFALAPGGNSPETFRLWEALSLGAIPISVAPLLPSANFFHGLAVQYNGCPLPVLHDWEALPAFMQMMTSQPALMDALQTQVMVWFSALKDTVGADVAAMVNGKAKLDPKLVEDG